ncbi:MAG: putative metallopeptidase [Bacteroidota bacterium]
MRFAHLKILFLFLSTYLLFSCDSRIAEQLEPIAYDKVAPELWIHFQKFEREATARGVDIDLRALAITGKIEPIPVRNIVGLCNHQATNGKEVIIDEAFWKRASKYEREAIIFHELGHCVLDRNHEDGVMDNGMCKSLMRSGFSPCFTLYNHSDHQEHYLDELFSGF